MRWGYVAAAAAVAGPFLWLLASGFGKDPTAIVSPLPGRVAPGFALETLEGRRVSLEEHAGRPVVLNFWATWCVPCAQEHGVLQAAARRHESDGVSFLSVVYEDEPEAIRRYLARAPLTYPTLVDVQGRTAVDYGVTGVPETFFIDREGVVNSKMVGPLTPVEIERRLAPILGGAARGPG